MLKLIDKHAVYKALKHEAETHEFYATIDAFNRAARIIDQMPTIVFDYGVIKCDESDCIYNGCGYCDYDHIVILEDCKCKSFKFREV